MFFCVFFGGGVPEVYAFSICCCPSLHLFFFAKSVCFALSLAEPKPPRLGRRLEEDPEAFGGGYCRLQMPLKPALVVRETVAGHRLGALEFGGGGGGWYLPAFQCIPAHSALTLLCDISLNPPRTPPCSTKPPLGGALSAVRAQCNYLGVWPY